MTKLSLLQRAEKFSQVLAELYEGDTSQIDSPRDRYILMLGAEVVRLREKLEKLGAVMRDEPEDDE